ncbi:MAG: hypothetical protein L3K13_06870 [Thermoplasmata archaeon]|nr:hypothetical protein [Thermoplasmata archaeon]
MTGFPPAVVEAHWRTKARTVLVSGDAESTVLSVARSIAERLDPNFAWLEIVDPRRQDPDPPVSGIPAERLFRRVLPDQLRPRASASRRKFQSLVRSDESPETLRSLERFLRLPELVQKLTVQAGEVGPRRLLAIGRGERLVGIYPDGSPLIAEFLHTLESYGLYVLVSYFGPGRRDWPIFDLVLRTHGTGPSASISVEKGDPGSALATGARFAVRALPGLLPSGAGS